MLRKVRQWLIRYLPAELAGTACALVATFSVLRITDQYAVAAFAAAIAESVGFYAVIAVGEWHRRRLGSDLSAARAGWLVLRTMVAEFGPAELLDSVALRPFAMYVGPLLTHGVTSGVLVGKVLADIFFYAIVIPMYELSRGRPKTWRKSNARHSGRPDPGSRRRTAQDRRRVP